MVCFIAQKRRLVTEVAFTGIAQGNKESLWSYIDWFTQVTVKFEGAKDKLQHWIFETGLPRDHPFKSKIRKKKVNNF